MQDREIQDVLDDIQDQKRRQLQKGGPATNLFTSEMKGSTLFQLNGQDFLVATSMSLSFLAMCQAAATQSSAKDFSINNVNQKDFRWLHSGPDLRYSLLEVCSAGGQSALNMTTKNMLELQSISRVVSKEKIDRPVRALAGSAREPQLLRYLLGMLDDVSQGAENCVRYATETRDVFTRWAGMTGELLAAVNKQQGRSDSGEDAIASTALSKASNDDIKKCVAAVADSFSQAEKHLDIIVGDFPESLTVMVSGALSNAMTHMPAIVSSALSAVMTTTYPAGIGSTPSRFSTTVNDPTYPAATGCQDHADYFYEYLGGEKGTIDWAIFSPSAITYFEAVFESSKSGIQMADTDASKKLSNALDKLIQVNSAIKSSNGSASTDIIASWKSDVKGAKLDITQLASIAGLLTSTSMPLSLLNLKTDMNSAGSSTKIASVNSTIRELYMTRLANEASQANYEATTERYTETITTAKQMESQFTDIQSISRTVEDITTILQSRTSTLTNLNHHFTKLETLSRFLSTLISDFILPRAKTLSETIQQLPRPNLPGLQAGDITRQLLYTLLLQLRAYYIHISDIAAIYLENDMKYFRPALDQLSRLSPDQNYPPPMMEKLFKDTTRVLQDSGQRVREFVKDSSDRSVNETRERVENARGLSERVEEGFRSKGGDIDQDVKSAIERGALEARNEAKKFVDAESGFMVGGVGTDL